MQKLSYLNCQVKLYNTEETTRELIEKLDILQKQFENKLVEDQGNATDREKSVSDGGNRKY